MVFPTVVAAESDRGWGRDPVTVAAATFPETVGFGGRHALDRGDRRWRPAPEGQVPPVDDGTRCVVEAGCQIGDVSQGPRSGVERVDALCGGVPRRQATHDDELAAPGPGSTTLQVMGAASVHGSRPDSAAAIPFVRWLAAVPFFDEDDADESFAAELSLA